MKSVDCLFWTYTCGGYAATDSCLSLSIFRSLSLWTHAVTEAQASKKPPDTMPWSTPRLWELQFEMGAEASERLSGKPLTFPTCDIRRIQIFINIRVSLLLYSSSPFSSMIFYRSNVILKGTDYPFQHLFKCVRYVVCCSSQTKQSISFVSDASGCAR